MSSCLSAILPLSLFLRGKNEKLDFVNSRFSMDNLFVVVRFRNGERNSEQRRYFRYFPYLLGIDNGA